MLEKDVEFFNDRRRSSAIDILELAGSTLVRVVVGSVLYLASIMFPVVFFNPEEVWRWSIYSSFRAPGLALLFALV